MFFPIMASCTRRFLATCTQKAANMSCKVHDGSRDGRGGAGGTGGGGGGAGSAFAEAGRSNVELLWRVTEAFCPGVYSVLTATQNTIRRERQQDGGGTGVDGGKVLSDAEKDVLEEGRKAVSSTQGPRLVTLGGYRDQAEELLVAIADLSYPRVSDGWLDKLSKNSEVLMAVADLTYPRVSDGWLGKLSKNLGIGPEPDKAEGWARAISGKVKELFGLPATWQPKGHRDGAGKEALKMSDLFHPERDSHAPSFLSNQGRAQLASGRRACKPWDAAYVGDPMYHPRCTWETRWSVAFWVGVSENVNERWLGWTPPADWSEDDRNETFEDEGPSRVIALGREFQRRVWSEGRWARLPRRLNLRPLADLRATLGLVVALYLLFVACRVSATLGTSFAAILLALALRLSVMK